MLHALYILKSSRFGNCITCNAKKRSYKLLCAPISIKLKVTIGIPHYSQCDSIPPTLAINFLNPLTAE